MSQRQIILDTETTGIDPKAGHRIIEIGAIEIIDREATGRHYHQYINPEREIDAGAFNVHGISNDFLSDKPVFNAIAKGFIDFVAGGELVIHNAPFDIGHINAELERLSVPVGLTRPDITQVCSVLDTLLMARQKHPGQRNSLDALCKRYNVDNSSRELHGALLDAQILAEVYLAMTGGQMELGFNADTQPTGRVAKAFKPATVERTAKAFKVIQANHEELAEHEAMLQKLEKIAGKRLWQ